MAISSRQAGAVVECPTCGEQTQVPDQDIFTPQALPQDAPADVSDVSEPPPIPSRESGQAGLAASLAPTGSEPVEESLTSAESLAAPSDSAESDESSDVPFTPDELDGDDDGANPLAIRRHRIVDEEMDLTPMVDVTFQLLIFFMVSASFSLQKSIEVPLPDPDQKGASQQVQMLEDLLGTSIILKVDAGNTIWIDDEPLGDPLRLADTLRDKMRREQKTELLVTADTQSQHRTVIAVIDAANEAGMQKIRMTSRKKSD